MERRAVDSCGRIGIGETPQCGARGGSPAARGKRLPAAEINQYLRRIIYLCVKNNNLLENSL
nr:hypothetical protein [Virgibacillus necropolis]